MKVFAIILTFNESKHIKRCIESLTGVVDQILIVDSYSEDDTLEIAKKYGAIIIQHPFTIQSEQFNWALTQLDKDVDWLIRLDADEYLTEELVSEIKTKLPLVKPEIEGIYLNRRMTFQGRLIKYGGVFPVRVLRLFRYGCGQCEKRWMDEHITVAGKIENFSGELIDDNLNNLSWWTDKQNKYSSREAIDLLNLEFHFSPRDSIAVESFKSSTNFKRWFKEIIYSRMPGGIRAFLYFFYRYVIRFGFLDGASGTAFHVLQGFWYRYLVDVKIAEVKRYMKNNKCDIVKAIQEVLDIKI